MGNLFLIGEDENTSVSPINETYTEVVFVNNITIMLLNITTAITTNAVEIENVTVNVQPDGVVPITGNQTTITSELN